MSKNWLSTHQLPATFTKQFAIAALKLWLVGAVCVAPTALSAQTATATANSATATGNPTLTNHSVDDIVAISKTAQTNDALNDAVFNNDAIKDTLGNDALHNDALPINPNGTNSSTTTANGQATATANANTNTNNNPRQSTQAPIAADKLILNNPVIDEAKVLSASDKQAIEAKLRSINDRGLAQAAVVIVPSTNGEDIFDYSMKIADRWKLGKKDTDQGLLMVVAVNDHKIYILTGYGLEGTIPDAVAKRIITDDITPYFKQGDYAGGITAGINRIEERLTADPTILKQADANKQTQQDVGGMSPIFLAIFGFVVGTILTSILGRFFGSIVTAGGVVTAGTLFGAGFFSSVLVAILLLIFLMMRGGGGRGGGGGGPIFIPGGFGGGGFGGGGFGGGGFGGGGGGFGGGGAGGSW